MEKQVPASIGVLARSARKRGIDLEVCFVGEAYHSHAEMKIRRLRRVIESLRTPRVLYLDGRDSLFVAGLDRIEDAFGSMNARMVMSSEAECWPVAELAQRFPSHPGGCKWLNAGQWMGQREVVVQSLGLLEEMWNHARAGFQRGEHRELSAHPHVAVTDDQFLWQVAWFNGLVELTQDYEGRIFRNVNTLDRGLGSNRDFDLGNGDDVVFRARDDHASCTFRAGRRTSACTSGAAC